MKTVKQYLNECKDLACHNLNCYSKNYDMTVPKEGSEEQFAEAQRDVEIVEGLIKTIDSKTITMQLDLDSSNAEKKIEDLACSLENLSQTYEKITATKTQTVTQHRVLWNEKDIYCLAQHFASFFEQAKNDEKTDWAKPCTDCKFLGNCKAEWTDLAYKIRSSSDINISLFKYSTTKEEIASALEKMKDIK